MKKKIHDKKTLEKEAELWAALRKKVESAPVKVCRK